MMMMMMCSWLCVQVLEWPWCDDDDDNYVLLTVCPGGWNGHCVMVMCHWLCVQVLVMV